MEGDRGYRQLALPLGLMQGHVGRRGVNALFKVVMSRFLPCRDYHQRDGSFDGVYFNCLCYSWISPSVSTKNNTFFTITDHLRSSTYISTSITKLHSTAPDGALFACMVFCIIRHLRCPTRCIANMTHLLVSCRNSP